MFKKIFYFLGVLTLLTVETGFAQIPQQTFYNSVFTIDSNFWPRSMRWYGPHSPHIVKGWTMSGASNLDEWKWYIMPTHPGSQDYFIVHKQWAAPMRASGQYFVLHFDHTDHSTYERYQFINSNGSTTQIQPMYANGVIERTFAAFFYYDIVQFNSVNTGSSSQKWNLTVLESIPGSSNIDIINLVQNHHLLNAIPEPPDLTSYTQQVPLISNETIIGESWIPFVMVKNDGLYGRTNQAVYTPYYKLIRKQAWKKIKDYSYEPGATYQVVYKKYVGITQSQSITTQTVLENGWSMNGNAEFEVAAIKVTLGGSYSSKLVTTTTIVNSFTTNTWEERDETLQFSTNQNVRLIVYELQDRYSLERMDGSQVIEWEIFYPEFYKFRTWSAQPVVIIENQSTHTTTISDPGDPLSLTISGPSVLYTSPAKATSSLHRPLPTATGTYTANPSGGIGSYTYYWETRSAGSSYWSYRGDTQSITHTTSNDFYVKCTVTSGYETASAIKFVDVVTGDEEPFAADALVTRSLEVIRLEGNYPNPFNPVTNITFGLPEQANIKLTVYATTGQKIKILAEGSYTKGYHTFQWDGTNYNGTQVSSGVYFYELLANDTRILKKMIFAK